MQGTSVAEPRSSASPAQVVGRVEPAPPRLAGWAVAGGLILFALALWVLHRELAHTHLADVRRAFGQVPASALLLAGLGTACSYLALTGYDVLALAHLKLSLPYRRVAVASFIATAVGHNLGAAMLTAGAVRLRLYTALGLSAADVATMAALIGLTFGIGLCFAAGAALWLEPSSLAPLMPLGHGGARVIAALLLALVLAYLLLAWRRKRPLRLGAWQLQPPAVGTALGQIALALADLSCAALALWALLPSNSTPGFVHFVAVYVLAVAAGIVSHVPGGLGVFETVLLLALPQVGRDSLLAAILGYRAIYYLAPLTLAALMAALLAAREARRRVARAVGAVRPLFAWLAPTTSSAAVFVAGAVLLLSGSLPVVPERVHLLHRALPLPVIEVSHLVGSLLGLGLLILSQALYRRVALAYHLAVWMLVAATAASLLKGLDAEESMFAAVVLATLWLGRRAFNRPAAISANVLSPAWAAAIAAVLIAMLWIGLFAYKRVEYSNELWWRFALRADASRFLRASLAVTVVGIGVVLWRALRPAPPEPGVPSADDIERAARVVAAAPAADAALALLGDKRLLFDASARAFVMYQVRGRSWIAMGDPVGDPAAAPELAWRLREMADRHGGRTVFYQVDAANLPIYVDMGLGIIKLGEEALVPLTGFSLDGPKRRELRQTHARALRDGLSFEILDAGEVPAMIDELRAVSDAWLHDKHGAEKGFSVGRFEPAYLSRFPCAVVRHAGGVVAFANVWAAGARHELSVDLMRHLPDAPGGVMDFLFAELMLWGSREGYGRFNLGMTPLAGLETHPLAPLWHRLGTVVYRHGEHFYNFRGLRAYKAKFDPQWQPRYMAGPGGIALPGVLLDVATLIGGGVKGVWQP